MKHVLTAYDPKQVSIQCGTINGYCMSLCDGLKNIWHLPEIRLHFISLGKLIFLSVDCQM